MSVCSKLCSSKNSGHAQTFNEKCSIWLAKWCKIHKVYIHLHSMLLLLFTNIFIHIQQPNLHSRNIFIHIYRCLSYSRLYLLTYMRCLDSHSTCYIHSHSQSKYSFSIFCAPPLRIIRSQLPLYNFRTQHGERRATKDL